MNKMIEVKNLQKSYKTGKAVDGVSFDVYKGEILCILGPNGAGKSTTINMLTGALGWDGGGIYADFLKGKSIHDDLPAYKRRLGVVPQDLAIYEDLSARNNVEFFASLYGLRGRALQEGCRFALAFAGLTDRREIRPAPFPEA